MIKIALFISCLTIFCLVCTGNQIKCSKNLHNYRSFNQKDYKSKSHLECGDNSHVSNLVSKYSKANGWTFSNLTFLDSKGHLTKHWPVSSCLIRKLFLSIHLIFLNFHD